MNPELTHIKALSFDVFGTCVDFRGSISLKTAFVRRPHEHGRNSNKDLADEPSFTINADDMVDLAAKLEC